jgi:antitoxin component YwqK of YwqJK toxin-antitoxin module
MATLTEIKTDTEHYFEDEFGNKQGEYKAWYSDGQLWVHCFYVDDKVHGEYKLWYSDGQIWVHCYYVDDSKVIDFRDEPDEYPTSEEAKTYFALKYGSGKWL